MRLDPAACLLSLLLVVPPVLARDPVVQLPNTFGVFNVPTSFGVDSDGELYVLFENGSIEQLVPVS